MDFVKAYAVTHRKCPIDKIGQLGNRRDELYTYLKGEARGLVILATCNRLEVYVDSPTNSFESFLKNALGDMPFELYEGLNAIRHLIEVASGLDSQILGEHEIMGQVREAWSYAKRIGASSKTLDYVFSRALQSAKRIRRETRIGYGVVGYPQAGIELLALRLGGLSGRSLMIIGAGHAGETALKHLCKKYKPSRVIIANRTPERATALTSLCSEVEVLVTGLDKVKEFSTKVDGVFVAISGGVKLLSASDVENSKALIVDISTPPVVEKVYNKVFYMEDVKALSDENLKIRLSEVPKAYAIIEQELEKTRRFLERVPIELMIADLMKKAKELYITEAKRASKNGRELVSEEFVVVLDSYMRKVLRPLLLFMRTRSTDGNLNVIKDLYDLYVNELERMIKGESRRVSTYKT
ncbi:MAG: NAD(P)-binding domain-containing protein [Acidilobaceae archaeon]